MFKEKVTFLGHVVSKEGISTDPEKMDAVLNLPVPKTLTELRSFLGLCFYYRKFIKAFASLAKPLHYLTEKDVKIEWNCDCYNAFTKLNNLLTQAPVLSYPEPSSFFILDTDPSGVALEAVLSQVQVMKRSSVIIVGIHCECRKAKDLYSSIVNWIEGKASEDIRQAQDQDRCIGIIKKWKMTGEIRPRWKHIGHTSTNGIGWSEWTIFIQIMAGTKETAAHVSVSFDQSLRDLALSQLHNQATSGHMGIK